MDWSRENVSRKANIDRHAIFLKGKSTMEYNRNINSPSEMMGYFCDPSEMQDLNIMKITGKMKIHVPANPNSDKICRISEWA